jgi:hypothetical protein
MAIFSAARRQSALLDDGMLRPDSRIDTRDRMALLGQYGGALPAGATGDASGLSFRHQRLFDGLADLWSPVDPIGTSGGLARTYQQEQTSVPYVLDRKSAVDSPELVGLLEGEDMVTVDTCRFPPATVLGTNWIVVDKSITIAGAEGQNYGQGWVVKGDPVSEDDLDDLRRAGMVEAYVTRLTGLPEGVG